jgi:hypothetical protein
MATETAAQKKKRLAAEAAAAAAKQQEAVYAQIQSQYGLTDAILSMDPTGSLKAAFDWIRTNKITDPVIAANKLAETAWFKDHGVEVTKNFAMEQTSPGIFAKNVESIKEQLRDEAASLGKSLTEADLDMIARDTFLYGRAYNSSQVINSLVSKGAGTAGGTYGTAITDLKAHAGNMGVQYNEDWYKTAADKVAIGDMTPEDFKAQINELAKSKYSVFADQIDRGITVQQAASPYINSMANILELNPVELKLSDPTINQALTGVNQDNKPTLKPLWQFETDLRKDPRWGKTQNARQTTDATAHNILQSFGLVS